eukprot:CAMPEP_0180180384 /NCGR_PEP_ID=MMETSP0986-20121125/39554_1 /TAXON_ID=697907 /ORGANISM="non described non described, Strain CCMP2293" /LENGTH=90 /DNA_ID=CAMNT_0022133583 /DNA_START=248 /DNA_END=520 /DNA_ORIENTATION=-
MTTHPSSPGAWSRSSVTLGAISSPGSVFSSGRLFARTCGCHGSVSATKTLSRREDASAAKFSEDTWSSSISSRMSPSALTGSLGEAGSAP